MIVSIEEHLVISSLHAIAFDICVSVGVGVASTGIDSRPMGTNICVKIP